MEEKTFGPDSTNTSNQGCHWASLHKEWESVQGHGLHIHYSECNFSLQDHSHTHTHTQVLSLCLPEHSLRSLCCCLFESRSVILDQRVQRDPRALVMQALCPVSSAYPTCCLGGAEVGQGGTSLPWLTLKTSERWYRQSVCSVSGACCRWPGTQWEVLSSSLWGNAAKLWGVVDCVTGQTEWLTYTVLHSGKATLLQVSITR